MSSELTAMEKITLGLGGSIVTVSAVLIFVPLSTCFGALTGWVVGMFFGDTILGVLGQIGVHNTTMWQFGAFTGFVGGFLKTKVTATVKASD